MSSSRRQEMRDKRKKAKATQRTIWIVLAGIVVVLLVIFFVRPLLSPSKPAFNSTGFTRGDPNAPVKIVEFADFQCPACQYFFVNTEPSLKKDYIDTGKVFYTYTPVAFIGQESVDAAEAAYCANEQGKFWDYHDILFSNQKSENAGDFTQDHLDAFAQQLNLDMTAFQTCTKADKYQQVLQENMQTWTGAGLSQTPSFLVNGKATLYEDLKTTLDSLLGAQ